MKRRTSWVAALVAVSIALAAGAPAGAGEPVAGAGSTFAQKIIQKWSEDVSGQGVQVSYKGTGSGDGRAQLIAGSVDFAASDVPAPAADAEKLRAKYGDIVHVAATSGGIGVVYNVSGAGIKLSGPTLAKIFSGAIKNWNDPAIAGDNGSPGPDLAITVFVRSDKSGSSGVFTGYLSAAGGGEWKAGTTETFPTDNGQQGKEGGSGVADAVKATNGAVGYVDHGVAQAKGLAEVLVKNAAGQFRPPEPPNVSAAIDEAKTKPDGTLEVTYEPKNPRAYPISTVSYVIAPTKLGGTKAETLKAFLGYALSAEGQGKAAPLGYAPLSEKLQGFGQEQVAKIGPA